jgi:hypothetical protein
MRELPQTASAFAFVIPAIAAVLPAGWPALAQSKGDRDLGEYISSQCVTCHQLSGQSDGIPSIARWPQESFKPDLVNLIPAQMADRIARNAVPTNQKGFRPIDSTSMRSAVDLDILVIGDACIPGDMPKFGFASNSQAKVAAMMIRGGLVQSRTFPACYANTCWSLIAADGCVKFGGRYEAAEGKIKEVEGFISKTSEPPELRKQTLEENFGWYAGITSDVFG